MRHLAVLIGLAAGAAFADPVTDDALARLAEAEAALATAEDQPSELAALTLSVQAYESGLSAVRAAQRDVTTRAALLQDEVAAQEAQIAELVTTLTVLARSPQAVRQAHPDGPVATLRAGMVVAGVTSALEGEVARVAALLDEARDLQDAADAVEEALASGMTRVAAARENLQAAITDNSGAARLFDEDSAETAQLAADAETLGALAAKLAAVRPDPGNSLAPEGNLPLPTEGYILSDDGSGRAGVRIAGQPRALVTTPVTATVLYAGEFLDYGTVIILEPAPELLFVIAGVAEVFAQPGQVLPAGAAIGLLPGEEDQNDGNLTEITSQDAATSVQTLYLEVREGQTPAQPDRWFSLE